MGDPMRYAALKKNDIINGEGISVSFWAQGCPIKCPGCHNHELWSFSGGKEFTYEVLNEIIDALRANGIKRNLSILGGEPLCPENEFLTLLILKTVKEKLPDTKVYLWTGYYYEDLAKTPLSHLNQILDMVDILIDGPYDASKRDVTLKLRGSTNQSIINLKEIRNGN